MFEKIPRKTIQNMDCLDWKIKKSEKQTNKSFIFIISSIGVGLLFLLVGSGGGVLSLHCCIINIGVAPSHESQQDHVQEHDAGEEEEEVDLAVEDVLERGDHHHVQDVADRVRDQPDCHHDGLHALRSLGEAEGQGGDAEHDLRGRHDHKLRQQPEDVDRVFGGDFVRHQRLEADHLTSGHVLDQDLVVAAHLELDAQVHVVDVGGVAVDHQAHDVGPDLLDLLGGRVAELLPGGVGQTDFLSQLFVAIIFWTQGDLGRLFEVYIPEDPKIKIVNPVIKII